jgi:hypothetical protein
MKAIATVLLLIIALPFLWYGSALAYHILSEHSYRFRVTVEVETPEGVRTGSSVIHFSVRRNPSWFPPGSGTVPRVVGEAVFVDLGAGRDGRQRHLIALLAHGSNGENPNYYLMPARAFFTVPGHQGTLAFGGYADRLEALPLGARAELFGSNIPTLVTFGDLRDPRTARLVAPDHLEEEFGAGYRLRQVWIEKVWKGWWPINTVGLSGERITRSIEQRLTWLETIKGYLTGRFACDARLESCLDVASFRRG